MIITAEVFKKYVDRKLAPFALEYLGMDEVDFKIRVTNEAVNIQRNGENLKCKGGFLVSPKTGQPVIMVNEVSKKNIRDNTLTFFHEFIHLYQLATLHNWDYESFRECYDVYDYDTNPYEDQANQISEAMLQEFIAIQKTQQEQTKKPNQIERFQKFLRRVVT